LSAPLAERRPGAPYVTGLFEDEAHAQQGFDRLVKESFDPHEVSVVRVDDRHREVENVPVEHKSGMPAGVTTGVALGGTVGLAGAVLGGPLGLLAAGPILAALQGAFVGAASGGLLGALAGMAFWKDEPDLEGELQRGSVFVGVTAEGARADMARRALEEAGAKRIFG
jgi:hypothetical protein